MSVKQIIQESINKNPLGLKEALEGELRGRIALALEAKVAESEHDDEDDEEDDEDEDDLDEASDYDKMTTAELKAAAQSAIKKGDRDAVKAITAAANNRITNKGGTPVTTLTTDPKKLDALKKQFYDIKNK